MEDKQGDFFGQVVVIIMVCLVVYFRVKRARFWSKHGIRAVARVIKIQDSGRKGYSGGGVFTSNGGVGYESGGIIWDLHLDIEQQELPARRLYIDHRFKDGFGPPQAGDFLDILIHPKKPDKIVILPRNEPETAE